jgi:hypothetical protein
VTVTAPRAALAERVRSALGQGLDLARSTVFECLRRLRRDGFIGDGRPFALTDTGMEAVG